MTIEQLVKPVCRASVCTNGKLQIYPNGYCKLTACSDPIFVPPGLERVGNSADKKNVDKLVSDEDELAYSANSRSDNIRRARQMIFNICMLNDFSHFVTWTLDPGKVDRFDDLAVKSKFQNFLSNSVQRKDLVYLFVPERHKSGAVHFHGLIKGNYNMIESGTVAVRERKKPVKLATAKRFGWTVLGPVYNVSDWRNGWSTAIELYDSRDRVSKYIAKYVTKESEKIYGSYYFAGGHGLIRKPQTICIDVDFERIPGKVYQVEGMNRCFRYMECYRLDDIPLVGV